MEKDILKYLNKFWHYEKVQSADSMLPKELTPEASMIASVIAYFSGGDADVGFEAIDRDIREDYFSTNEAKLIWAALVKMKLTEMSLDPPTLFSVIRDTIVEGGEDVPKELGIICADLFTLEFTASATNMQYHVRRFLMQYYRRAMAETLRKKSSDAFAKGDELRAKIDDLSKLDKSKTANIHSSSDVARGLFDRMLDREMNPEKYETLNWHFEQHDRKIPLSRGHLVIVGGRSGSGKTTYAMNLLRKQLEAGQRCAVFSLEMSRDELAQILISQIGRVPYESFNKLASLTENDFDAITATLDRFESFKAAYIDLPAQSAEDIRRQSIQVKTKLGGLDFIFIDHIHIMGDGEKRFNSVREKIMHISVSLKNLAKEMGVPVVALAQMNRNVEARPDKTPNVADLKESGSLEQDADTIVFTYRCTDVEKNDDPYIICRKNRHGVENDFKIFMRVDPVYKIFEEAHGR